MEELSQQRGEGRILTQKRSRSVQTSPELVEGNRWQQIPTAMAQACAFLVLPRPEGFTEDSQYIS